MWLSGAVVTLSFVAQAISQTPATYFLNPPATGDNPIYTVGSQIDVQWITNMTSYNIFLWQQDLNVQAAAEGTQPIYSMLTFANACGRSFVKLTRNLQRGYLAPTEPKPSPGQ